MKIRSALSVLLILALPCAACEDADSESALGATDYSITGNWLSLPSSTDKAVDIFYLYPTAWQKESEAEPNICEIDNASMRKGAPAAFARQATAFETVGNIYAPYYRQADAGYVLALSLKERDKVIGDIPTLDVVAAFDYYIQHYNEGRPFILAGHSQGSNVLLHLLSGYMKDNPAVYDRMIAAYVIGYSVTSSYLADNAHLRFAEGPEDTRVIISYNTQSPTVAAGANPVVSPGGVVINPIHWTRAETVATTDQGLGSFMPDPVTKELTKVPQYADAKVDTANGVLICSTANEEALFSLSGAFGKGVYHSFDYLFYYYNLRDNAAVRANKFLAR